jgi:hypothetical protein
MFCHKKSKYYFFTLHTAKKSIDHRQGITHTHTNIPPLQQSGVLLYDTHYNIFLSLYKFIMKIIQTGCQKSARKMICRKPQAAHVVPSFKS